MYSFARIHSFLSKLLCVLVALNELSKTNRQRQQYSKQTETATTTTTTRRAHTLIAELGREREREREGRLTFLVAQLVDKLLGARGYVELLEHDTFNVLRPDALLVTIPGRQFDLVARLIEGNDIEAVRLARQMLAEHQVLLLQLKE